MKTYHTANGKSFKADDLFYEYKLGAKPFLKWVGGKRQLLEQFEKLYPIELKINCQ